MNKYPAFFIISVALLVTFLSKHTHGASVICEPDPGTDMMIEYGDTVSCSIDGLGDSDTFHFLGSAGDDINSTAAGSTQLTLELYSPSGAFIRSAGGSASSFARLAAELTEDGVHTLLVLNPTSSSDPYDYTLDLPCLGSKCVGGISAVDTLGYSAVASCRIVDTRYGIGGPMSAGETRSFHTYGDVSDQNSAAGGAPSDYPEACPFALGEHSAVHLSVSVVPLGKKGQKGSVRVWAFGETKPDGSWVYFKRVGTLKYVNTGTVMVNSSNGATPEISVSATKDVDIFIDVLGYYTE